MDFIDILTVLALLGNFIIAYDKVRNIRNYTNEKQHLDGVRPWLTFSASLLAMLLMLTFMTTYGIDSNAVLWATMYKITLFFTMLNVALTVVEVYLFVGQTAAEGVRGRLIKV